MSIAAKIFAFLWFLIIVPALFFFMPTMTTFAAAALVTVIFICQTLSKLSWRCNDCGHFTSLRTMPGRLQLLRGMVTCSHCGHVQRHARSYVRRTT